MPEYKVRVATEADGLEECLNDYTKKGWRLDCILPDFARTSMDGARASADYYTVIFSRERSEEK